MCTVSKSFISDVLEGVGLFSLLCVPDPVTFLGPSVCVTDSRQIGMRDGLGEVNFRRNSLKDMY